MADKENDMLFVGIRDHIDIRKNMLESSKNVIGCLQRYEKLRITREDKEKEVQKLRLSIKEIEEAIIRLKNTLPKVGLKSISEKDEFKEKEHKYEITEKIEEVRMDSEEREKEREQRLFEEEIKAMKKKKKVKKKKRTKKPVKKTKKVVVSKPVPKKKRVNELEVLEKELKNIENKLGSL